MVELVYGLWFMILNPSIRPQEKRPPGFSTDEPHPLQAAPGSRSEFNSDEMDEEMPIGNRRNTKKKEREPDDSRT